MEVTNHTYRTSTKEEWDFFRRGKFGEENLSKDYSGAVCRFFEGMTEEGLGS